MQEENDHRRLRTTTFYQSIQNNTLWNVVVAHKDFLIKLSLCIQQVVTQVKKRNNPWQRPMSLECLRNKCYTKIKEDKGRLTVDIFLSQSFILHLLNCSRCFRLGCSVAGWRNITHTFTCENLSGNKPHRLQSKCCSKCGSVDVKQETGSSCLDC